MQISGNSTTYGSDQAQRLLGMLLQDQGSSGGQDLPGATDSQPPSGPPPIGGPSGAQFTSNTLSSLLSAQEAPTSAKDVAAKLISDADTDGDGSLSLDEIKTAMGSGAATSSDAADPLAAAFAKLDTDGDGKLSADELTGGLQKAHGGHHGHHARPSSDDMASKLISAADTNGDGSLSPDEIAASLGGSDPASSDTFAKALGKLDTDGDGKLNAAELSKALDAFRAAHQHGSQASTDEAQSAQATTSA